MARAEDASDLVIPSLPGYGFSGKPATPIGTRTTARLFDAMMREGFGNARYCAQGGDWGSAVTAWLALEHGAALPETQAEREWQTGFAAAQQALGAYAMLQGTKPQSLGYAMMDNPVAQLAWLVERFHDWADLRERPFEQVFPMNRLLTNAMIYLMNDAFVTATWYYAGAVAEGLRRMPEGRRVDVSTAFTAYRDPRVPSPPRSWVERGYALSRWVEQPRGGHFAAMEVPDLFVADLHE